MKRRTSSVAAESAAQFAEAMQARGLIPPTPLHIGYSGTMPRCDVAGKRQGNKAAAYCFFGAYGGFQNFTDGAGWQSWSYGDSSITSEERRSLRDKVKKLQKETAAQIDEWRRKARGMAEAIWDRSTVVVGQTHPYLALKRVSGHGIREWQGRLVVPVRDVTGGLHGLQFIDAPRHGSKSAEKKFLKGTAKAGHFHLLGSIHEEVYICEGYATGATIFESTMIAVVVAFDAGNLLRVAKVIRQQYPRVSMTICGDNDAFTENNPGIAAAKQAANEVGARLAIPDFDEFTKRDLKAAGILKPTDFNDLAQIEAALDARYGQ